MHLVQIHQRRAKTVIFVGWHEQTGGKTIRCSCTAELLRSTLAVIILLVLLLCCLWFNSEVVDKSVCDVALLANFVSLHLLLSVLVVRSEEKIQQEKCFIRTLKCLFWQPLSNLCGVWNAPLEQHGLIKNLHCIDSGVKSWLIKKLLIPS